MTTIKTKSHPIRSIKPGSLRPGTTIDIDDLYRDTALLVVALNNNGKTEQGEALHQLGIKLVKEVKATLEEAKIAKESGEHLLYAQCALLDETVLNRNLSIDKDTTAKAVADKDIANTEDNAAELTTTIQGTALLAQQKSKEKEADSLTVGNHQQENSSKQSDRTTTTSAATDKEDEIDNGYTAWMVSPLQTVFFNTLNAGEMLVERMRQVLQQPAPDPLVLAGFQRVLTLGFKGRYRDRPALESERQALLAELTERTGQMHLPSLAAQLLGRYRHGGSFWSKRSPFFWGCAGVALIGLLWLALSWGLSHALLTWLPTLTG